MSLAETVGREMALRSVRLIYGGGGIGLMGAVAGAALDNNGQVIGVIPGALMAQEVGNIRSPGSNRLTPWRPVKPG